MHRVRVDERERGRRHWWHGIAGLLLALAAACVAPAPSGADGGHRSGGCWRPGSRPHRGCIEVRFTWMDGFDEPSTPDELDRVGVLKVGPRSARNVLVLNPGTSAGAGYFHPLAEDIVRQTRGRWQVWSVERRENQLEDQSVADQAKRGEVTTHELNAYYLGWLTNPGVTEHLRLIPDAEVAYARNWGMNVEIEDLHVVVQAAAGHGRRVVLGGHSLGGSITSAYATWDFGGQPGAAALDGLVFIDGGSGPTPVTPEQAQQSLDNLQTSTPWFSFGGLPTPFSGLFGVGGGLVTLMDPDSPAIGQASQLLPAELKPPVPATNKAQFGYSLDTETSPPGLWAAQAHLGRLAAVEDPGGNRPGAPPPPPLAGWDQAGEITPIDRYAEMFSGFRLTGVDGLAWYHPARLSIDSGAVGAGNANPAQEILDVHAIHGDDLGSDMLIYAFGAFGGQLILNNAQALADQSGIPAGNLTLVNGQEGYAHNDPASASPDNDFLENLIPFLGKVTRR